MKELYVNAIHEENGITHGLVGFTNDVKKNLRTIYGNKKFEAMEKAFFSKGAAYFFDRFCQYIVFVQYDPNQGYSMKISDFHKNVDSALDEYRDLQKSQWNQKDIDKIMKLFNEIERMTNRSELATMVLRNQMPI